MKYLVIDTTKELPIQMVVEDGRRFGTTQLLDWRELADYALWVGVNGGRRMLDQFEVQLINDGMLYVWPVDEEGEPLHDECECQEVRHYGEGSRLAWIPKCECETCLGQGHFVMDGSEVEEEDLCMYCDGQGWTWGAEFETDMQGNPLQNTKFEGLRSSPLETLVRPGGRCQILTNTQGEAAGLAADNEACGAGRIGAI